MIMIILIIIIVIIMIITRTTIIKSNITVSTIKTAKTNLNLSSRNF